MSALSKLATVEDSLTPYLERAGAFWQRLPQERLRTILCALLLLWLLLGAVQLVWTLLSKPDPSLPSAETVLGQSGAQQRGDDAAVLIDMERVRSWQLFGGTQAVPDAAEVEQPMTQLSSAESNAEQTRLQIKLQGVIQTSDDGGRAIISYQGKQKQYAVGDELPVSNQVVLRRLLPDRVLIANRGKIEALYLFDKNANSSAVRQNTQAATPRPTARPQRARVGTDFRQRLLSNPSSLMELVRISEARENGEIVGYKVRPGKDPSRFKSMGFENNDVVTSINGITLDNPSNALQVFQMMRTAKEASFELQRAGEPVSLVVNLDEPEEDQEALEQ